MGRPHFPGTPHSPPPPPPRPAAEQREAAARRGPQPAAWTTEPSAAAPRRPRDRSARPAGKPPPPPPKGRRRCTPRRRDTGAENHAGHTAASTRHTPPERYPAASPITYARRNTRACGPMTAPSRGVTEPRACPFGQPIARQGTKPPRGAPLGRLRTEAHEREPEQYGYRTLQGLCDAEEACLGARAREAEGRASDFPASGAAPQPPPPMPLRPLRALSHPHGATHRGLASLPPPKAAFPPSPSPHARPGARPPRARGPTPHGAGDPEPGRGRRGPGHPPPPPPHTETLNGQSTESRHETRRGTNRMERPYRRPAQVPHAVRAPHRQGGGSANTQRARAHTRATGTRRGLEGQPDRARETHTPHGMAYRQAKERGTQTEGGNNRAGGRRTGTSPPPPHLPRAPRTHEQGTTPAKAVVAHSATHQPPG